MTFDQYISHPAETEDDDDTLLIGEGGQFSDDGHLRTVADRMVEACCGQTLADGTPTEFVAEVIGLTHDFAKLTGWAQKHLRSQPFQQSDEYRYYAFPSALITQYCLLEYRDEVGDYATEVATLVVAGHHDTQSPPEPSMMAEDYGRTTDGVRGTYDRVREQFEDIDGNVTERADHIIRTATDGAGSWEAFRKWHDHRTETTDDANDHLVYFARMGDGDTRDGYYADVIRLWTALKFADQTAREIQSVFGVSPYSKVFTLHHHLSNTYTGLGDHYTDGDIGRSPGALHAESWLSGLTLTTTVQLFESLAAPTARQATRVPSLYEAVVVIDEPQAIAENWWQIVPMLVGILVETYDATVILMTATQPGLVKYGSEELDTRELTDDTDQYTNFLATHPRVTYRLHDTVRTRSRDETMVLDYPTAGGRVSEATCEGNDVLAICNTRASAEDLYQHLTSVAEIDEDAPVELGPLLYDRAAETGELPTPTQLRQLALNTVNEKESDTVYAFLSGNVRPNDRSIIIDALYDNEAGGSDNPVPLLDSEVSVVLISTSVVEAGVDLSFDTVFRDYAPIPNIVQSGGRCNRSFGGKTGDVVIWRLAEPEDGNSVPSLVIHGGDGGNALPLLRETGRVLRRHANSDSRIDEATMVSDTVTDFYGALFEGPLNPGDEHLAAAVNSASMSELEGEHMIDDIENHEDVIVCLTHEEQDDLFSRGIEMADILSHPGAQVNTDPERYAHNIEVGKSTYIVIDARDESYHPVFGVR